MMHRAARCFRCFPVLPGIISDSLRFSAEMLGVRVRFSAEMLGVRAVRPTENSGTLAIPPLFFCSLRCSSSKCKPRNISESTSGPFALTLQCDRELGKKWRQPAIQDEGSPLLASG
jgi:hypothetical protein